MKNIDKLIVIFTWKFKGPRIAKTILKNKNEVRELKIPNFKSYYKAIVIKTLWYWCKDRHTDQYNRIESSEINPHIYIQMICDKGT